MAEASTGTGTGSRRAANRAATEREILTAARRLLAAGGPQAVSLRAVAGAVGMTAPGLYRYYPTHEDLLLALTDLVMGELVDGLAVAREAGPPGTLPSDRIVAMLRGFRAWCLGHPHEFQLAFGLSVAAADAPLLRADTPNYRRFAADFFAAFATAYLDRPFPVPTDDELGPAMARQLGGGWFAATAERLQVEVPAGLGRLFLDSWTRVFGLIALELYGHLRFALDDVGAFFEATLADFGRQFGFPYTPPAAPTDGGAGGAGTGRARRSPRTGRRGA